MAIEIERKFLVRHDGWKAGVVRAQRLADGLVAAAEGRKIRVRIYDARATLTVKGRREGLQRDEFEYDIPLADAQAMLAGHCDGVVIEKTRSYVPLDGLMWEIDCYHGVLEGIIIAEIELPHAETAFARPDWLGAEITGHEAYRKINMLRARLAEMAGLSD